MSNTKLRRLREAARVAQDGKCYWCRQPMLVKTSANRHETWNDPRVCTAEHLVPRSAGGKTTPENIRAACRRCNNGRAHRELKRHDKTAGAA